ncbi:MAG: UDP-2,3-diacylglucosamine diphosphatase LpxI [Candidatus Omnitrophica bacterium]|nr:UDP-2,3-diacylglucosamine diphosphatase LpxI [Candidatus Omnitrophota bacterium]
MPVRRIGLIAGNREFPLHVARAARALGIDLVAIALHEETSPELSALVPAIHWIHLGQVGTLLEILQRERVTELVMAGQVHPSRVTRTLAHLDAQGAALMARAATGQGRDLLKLFTEFLTHHGMTLLDSSALLKDWVPEAGVLTARRPTADEQAAIAFGRAKAEALAAAGIGQTVVVKAKAVVAVEGMDGTDATIRRAGQIAGPGTVVVKFPEPGHDRRFDIPVVGVSTVEAMAAAGATALGMAAGATLLLDRPAVLALADQHRLALVALA